MHVRWDLLEMFGLWMGASTCGIANWYWRGVHMSLTWWLCWFVVTAWSTSMLCHWANWNNWV